MHPTLKSIGLKRHGWSAAADLQVQVAHRFYVVSVIFRNVSWIFTGIYYKKWQKKSAKLALLRKKIIFLHFLTKGHIALFFWVFKAFVLNV